MSDQAYVPILRRVGKVLIAVGIFDILYMVYCIVNGYSYRGSFNIFAVIAGLFLLKGSLKAARIVTLLLTIYFISMLIFITLFPFQQQ